MYVFLYILYVFLNIWSVFLSMLFVFLFILCIFYEVVLGSCVSVCLSSSLQYIAVITNKQLLEKATEDASLLSNSKCKVQTWSSLNFHIVTRTTTTTTRAPTKIVKGKGKTKSWLYFYTATTTKNKNSNNTKSPHLNFLR